MATPNPTLQNLLEQRELKWIFVGGKGGVGKTTCSCSLAIQMAAVRSSVLIISTDPAHNLSDAFRQKLTRKPTLIEGFTNLSAMEIDPTPDDGGAEALDGAVGGGFLAELAGSIPGIDEAMSFAEVMNQVQTMDYSCIIFDTAPTGHTLRLLQFPSTLEKGLSKLMLLKGAMGGMMSQVSRMFGAPIEEGAADQMMGKLDQLKAVVEEVNTQFKDPSLTTFVCVCIPEFLSLYETERLVQELAKFEIDTHNVVINQVIFPEHAGSSKLLAARIRMQQKYLDQARPATNEGLVPPGSITNIVWPQDSDTVGFYDLYEDFSVVKLPLLEEEVRGTEALAEFSKNLMTPYQPEPPAAPADRLAELEEECTQLRKRCAELESQR